VPTASADEIRGRKPPFYRTQTWTSFETRSVPESRRPGRRRPTAIAISSTTYLGSGLPADPKDYVPRSPAIAAKLEPHSPEMTFEVIDWLKGASSLPLIIKGILRGDDAERAVAGGADAIIVSNHGGRGEDGAIATMEALPEVVDAVRGRIPVLVDGGIRRGSDVLKALAQSAKAVMIGRPYVWGLAAFGVTGVERVIDLLRAELASRWDSRASYVP